ncbi:hypothetical protein BV898_04808 [Hypsibius exemplaris]|uniref:SH3 domain-containing protein n=1 Tax=Hypsibius exemplaris TaxID=2072580 RepID=A0A1W0X1I8_HYPEX|nr:hypothetical protein BV898_04808 [Hypsibius exemplaris]
MPVALNFLDLAEPRLADNLKHNGETLVKFITVLGDFLQKSAAIYEQHGEELRALANQGRQQVEKLKTDGDFLIPSLLKTWDQMLSYTAAAGEENIDMANKLSSDITIRLLNSTGHRKIQTQKLFEERAILESAVGQAEDQFYQAQKNYIEAYGNYMLSNGDRAVQESQTKNRYLNSHNSYVLQLHRYNSVMDDYQSNILPQWFQEVENVYTDVYSVLCGAVIDLNQRAGIKAVNESKRCEDIIQMAKQVDSRTDLILFARGLDPVVSPIGRGKRIEFQPPAHSAQDGPKDEIVADPVTSKNTRTVMEGLLSEEVHLEALLKRHYQTLNDLLATQQKQLEMHLFNKVTSIQEEISETRKNIRTTKLRLSGIHGQLAVLDFRYHPNRRPSSAYLTPAELSEPIMTSTTNGGRTTRWKKAFFNLKRNGTLKREGVNERMPQEYTGSGSGSKLTTGQRSPKLRRNIFQQNSASDLNLEKNAIQNGSPMDVDPVYLLLKQGSALNKSKNDGSGDSGFGSASDRRMSKTGTDSVTSSLRTMMNRRNSSMSEPDSIEERVRGPMLNTRMKSISLDSPEQLHETVVQGRSGRPAPLLRGKSTVGMPIQQSPGNSRRILTMSKARGKSLDLGDGDDEKQAAQTLRSEPTRPTAPAPHICVCLQKHRIKGADELELRPGDRVLVLDSSQPDWWKGKCFSSSGWFPRECVARVHSNERVCVVTHALQLNENGTLLRLQKDDIVMTTGPDEAGMVPIRCGHQRACCPLKYLQVLDYFDM